MVVGGRNVENGPPTCAVMPNIYSLPSTVSSVCGLRSYFTQKQRSGVATPVRQFDDSQARGSLRQLMHMRYLQLSAPYARLFLLQLAQQPPHKLAWKMLAEDIPTVVALPPAPSSQPCYHPFTPGKELTLAGVLGLWAGGGN